MGSSWTLAGNLAGVRAPATFACALAMALSLGACGDEEKSGGSPDPGTERIDPPAKPPDGWHTISNRTAGFTLSVPRDWRVRKRAGATLVRSADRLLAITLAADRSEAGRKRPAARYVRQAFRAVPGFRGLRAKRTRRVRGSPYESRRVDGTGTLRSRKQRQHVAVAAFRRPGRVTYASVIFGANLRGRIPHSRELETLLASLRARRPGS